MPAKVRAATKLPIAVRQNIDNQNSFSIGADHLGHAMLALGQPLGGGDLGLGRNFNPDVARF
jgi:hypothetical protein